MNSEPSLIDYLTSLYFVEVVIAVLFGIALWLLVRKGRSISWPRETKWRSFLVIVGWFFTAIAAVFWAFLVYLMVGAWLTSMNPHVPKPASIVFLFIGAFVYFALTGIAGTAFQAATGSAREDIMEMIGRKD